MGNAYNIHTQINLIVDDLKRTARVLEKGKRVKITKSDLKEVINTALLSVQSNSKQMMKPRNVLNPIIAGDEGNSIFDELQKIIDDIGTVQYMIAHNDIRAADEMLSDIKKRL